MLRTSVALLLAATAIAAKPVGAPPSTPEEHAWFQQAHSPNGGSCCNESDGFREGLVYPPSDGTDGHKHPGGVILQEWRIASAEDAASQERKWEPGSYMVHVLGNWYFVDPGHVLPNKPANPTGAGVVFLRFNYPYVSPASDLTGYSLFIRCFAPGNMF